MVRMAELMASKTQLGIRYPDDLVTKLTALAADEKRFPDVGRTTLAVAAMRIGLGVLEQLGSGAIGAELEVRIRRPKR